MRSLFYHLPWLAAAAASLFVAWIAPARADDADPFENSKIVISDVDGDGGYRVTHDPVYAAIREKMIKRQPLAEVAQFLSPIRLPKTLWIYAEECGDGPGSSPHYSPGERALVVCYEFMKLTEDVANGIVRAETKKPGSFPFFVSRDGFISGLFAGVIMHEAGHALFDILDVPIFGRQEDAADEMSIFVALQFRRQLAELVVSSYADVWLAFGQSPSKEPDTDDPDYPTDEGARCSLDPFCHFSDVHGSNEQRFFNTVCLTYGSDPTRYSNFVGRGWIPPGRNCVAEYETLKRAFAITVYPFINEETMQKVMAHAWFKPNELK